MYARYHQQRQAKYAADKAARERELAEIRGEVPVEAQAEAEPEAAKPVPTSQPQPQNQQHHQKRR